MSSPKRHHEVPQMILRNFTDANGLLHCYRKDEDRYFSARPSKAFVHGGLYTVDRKPSGERDSSMERKLATTVEGPAHAILKKILVSARKGKVPYLSADETDDWIKFVHAQLLRTKIQFSDLDPSEIVLNAFNELEQEHSRFTPRERATILEPAEMKRATHEGWVDTLDVWETELYRSLSNKGLSRVRAAK